MRGIPASVDWACAMSDDRKPEPASLDRLSDEAFEKLSRRLVVIRRLASIEQRSRFMIEDAAQELGLHPSTVYRSLKKLGGRGTVRDLMAKGQGFPKGRIRLTLRQHEIIVDLLEKIYLTPAQPPLIYVTQLIGDACEAEGLGRPARASVIRRLKQIPHRKIVARREGAKAAEQATPRAGRFEVARPWDVWQIDHTLADVIVVDEKGRPIGRVWLTVVIDVCTRFVVAFYVGLEPPSVLRAATAIDLAVGPKDLWLTGRGLDYPWPAFGLPKVVHSDRASEFQAKAFVRALRNQGVDPFLRPAGATRYGGHIERLIGTLMGHCRILPGRTYRNPKVRGQYDSTAAARLRIEELELWFAHQILGRYHNSVHSALGETPLNAWLRQTEGLAPHLPDDFDSFRLDLFPQVGATITRQGINLFSDSYYCQELGEAFILGLRKVVVKYDPRDLSRIYVKKPDGGYMEVPYRFRREGPAPTLWLLKAARRVRKADHGAAADQTTIRRAVQDTEKLIAAASERSTKAARQRERLRLDRKPSATKSPDPTPPDFTWGGAFGDE